MRIGMVSTLCVFLSLIYSPSPATAQFNPILPPMPQAFVRKLPSSAKLSEFQAGADSRVAGSNADVVDKLRSLLQRRHDDHRQNVGSTEIRSLTQPSQCAHIAIIEAPNVDPKMIREMPKEFVSNMPIWQGPQPCCGDFRGSVVIPQEDPFVGPRRIDAPAPKPGMLFFVPKP